MLGVGAITARTCKRWIKRLKDGNFDVEDAEREGRPSLDIDDTISTCLQNDKYATTRSIVDEMSDVSKESVRSESTHHGQKLPVQTVDSTRFKRRKYSESVENLWRSYE